VVKGYAETDVFNELDVKLMQDAAKVVEVLPDPGQSDLPWRCHEVTRAVAHLLGGELAVVDGQYAGAQHSWIAFRGGDGDVRILDVYAVGRLPQVQLVDPNWSRGLGYVPAHLPRTDIDAGVVSFLIYQAEQVLGIS
jgi:hypothetical protein